MRHDDRISEFSSLGKKSCDPESPSYVPSIFEFTSPVKRRLVSSAKRYEAVKRRRFEKSMSQPQVQSESEYSDNDDQISQFSSVEVQTDLNMATLAALEEDYEQRSREIKQLKEQKNKIGSYPTQENLRNDEKLLKFYTGLSSFRVFIAIFNLVSATIPVSSNSKLSHYECFILTIMKLRLNLNNYHLAFRFSVSTVTVGRVFSRWIGAMDVRLSPLVRWPERESVQRTMPYCFQRHYGLQVTSIIDCFELFIEKPSNLLAKSCTWSSYKSYNTAKYLISITPQGTVSFVSQGFGGRTSDKYITEHSGYLNKLLPGDLVIADRGFNIGDSVAIMGARLEIPAFTKGREQLSAREIETTRKLANVRIHVERVIGVIRQRFTVLSATGVLSKEFVQIKCNDGVLLDCVVKVCCALNNMCDSVVPFD